MLRIPSAADVTPPLMAPLRKVEEEQFSPEELAEIQQATHAQEPNSRWLLVAGGLLMVGLFAGGATVFLAGRRTVVPPAAQAPVVMVLEPNASDLVTLEERSETSLISELRPLAVKFLDATSVAQFLPLVRNPTVTEARIRDFYPSGAVAPQGMGEFNVGGQLVMQDRWVSLMIQTRTQETKTMVFTMTPEGFKIDWESWVGWSEMTWERFLETKPVVPLQFRVNVFQTEYYNFEFSDDLKWQSFRLESPNGEHSVYGYVERGSDLAKQIRLDRDAKQVPMILTLKFPEGSNSNAQVKIDQVIADSWVEMEAP